MNSFFSRCDRLGHAMFLQHGIASEGTFTPKDRASMPCRMMVDVDPEVTALMGVEITKDQAVVRLLMDGISVEPKHGDVIKVGAIRYTIARRVRTDPGASWVFLCQL